MYDDFHKDFIPNPLRFHTPIISDELSLVIPINSTVSMHFLEENQEEVVPFLDLLSGKLVIIKLHFTLGNQ
jgi:hypothetical protein